MEDLSRQPDIPVDAIGAAGSTVVLEGKVTGDAQWRYTVKADGTQSWGPGSGAVDVSMGRVGVGAWGPVTDNAYDLGDSSHSLRSIYCRTSLIFGSTLSMARVNTSSTYSSGGPYDNLRFTLPASPDAYQDFFSFYPNGGTRACLRVTQKGELWIEAGKYTIWSRPADHDISGGHIISQAGFNFANAWTFELATIDGWEFNHNNSIPVTHQVQAIRIKNYEDISLIHLNGRINIGNQAADGSNITALTVTPGAHVNQVAGTEMFDVYLDLSRTVTWSTGAITRQRFFVIDNPEMAFNGASVCTKAATVSLEGAPIAGANATITVPVALLIGHVSNTTQDGIQLTRSVDAARNWISWTQGSTTTDFRMGMTVNGGSYDWAIYGGNGVAATPASPGTEFFRVSQAGVVRVFNHLLPGTDNAHDLGDATHVWRTAYATTFSAGNGSAGSPSIRFTSEATGLYTRGTTVTFTIGGSGVFEMQTTQASIIHATAPTLLFQDGVGGNILTGLYGGSALLEQRNSTNPQELRIYNTYTSSTNHERLAVQWASNICFIMTDKGAGGGTAREMIIGTNSSSIYTMMSNGTRRWQVDTSGHLIANTDNSYDIGASGATRPRTVYVGTSIVNAGYAEYAEIADPAAGAANTGRVYCKDNGGGKTQLVVRFNTGAVQVIATEP